MSRTSSILLRLASGLASVTAIACSDRVPTASVPPAQRAQAMQKAEPTREVLVSGRAIVEVRRLGVNLIGQVIRVDTGRYDARLDGEGRASGKLMVAGTSAELVALEASGSVKDRGRHDRKTKLKNGRTIRVSRSGDAPADEIEVSDASGVVARISYEWERLGSYWRLSRTTQTLYANGKPSASISTVLESGSVTESTAGLRAGTLAVGAGRAWMTGDDGVCDAELSALFEAEAVFDVTALGVTACLAGPWTCLGAELAVFTAGFRLKAAADRLEACLERVGGES
jgi:hypothetical protein